ncbi:uncharacterized protein [Dermacentor albipictus]|uniref:uncharacterized protein n=1 Tax=Dermacentor albipictus TaxID=60249 RepID=UPI0038FC6793
MQTMPTPFRFLMQTLIVGSIWDLSSGFVSAQLCQPQCAIQGAENCHRLPTVNSPPCQAPVPFLSATLIVGSIWDLSSGFVSAQLCQPQCAIQGAENCHRLPTVNSPPCQAPVPFLSAVRQPELDALPSAASKATSATRFLSDRLPVDFFSGHGSARTMQTMPTPFRFLMQTLIVGSIWDLSSGFVSAQLCQPQCAIQGAENCHRLPTVNSPPCQAPVPFLSAVRQPELDALPSAASKATSATRFLSDRLPVDFFSGHGSARTMQTMPTPFRFLMQTLIVGSIWDLSSGFVSAQLCQPQCAIQGAENCHRLPTVNSPPCQAPVPFLSAVRQPELDALPSAASKATSATRFLSDRLPVDFFSGHGSARKMQTMPTPFRFLMQEANSQFAAIHHHLFEFPCY